MKKANGISRFQPLLIAALLVCTSHLCFGAILEFFPTPQEDLMTQHQFSERKELKSAAAELFDLVENRINPLGRDGIDRILGPKLSEPPKDMALPFFAPDFFLVDGIEAPRKPEFHALGDLGYIECFYQKYGNTNDFLQWGWFHRIDNNFVPVRSADDFEKRLAWDKAKLAEIARWLDEHLPKFKDLGIVEVSASAPARIGLGNGKDCVITTRIGTVPASTNWYYHAIVTTDITKEIRKPLTKTNEVIGFSAAGDYYTATLRLTQSPFKDLGEVELLENTPTSLNLGDGRQCGVTAATRHDGGISLKFDFKSPNPDRISGYWVNKLGDSLCFTTEGRIFKFTPVLKTK
jgi:hypothetical protein